MFENIHGCLHVLRCRGLDHCDISIEGSGVEEKGPTQEEEADNNWVRGPSDREGNEVTAVGCI